MSNVIDLKKHVESSREETLKALGVGQWNVAVFKLHSQIASMIRMVTEPIKSVFDTTPTLSETEIKALNALGGENLKRLEAERARADYRG